MWSASSPIVAAFHKDLQLTHTADCMASLIRSVPTLLHTGHGAFGLNGGVCQSVMTEAVACHW